MKLAIRIAIIMLIGAWTIWPEPWGGAVLAYNSFPNAPILTSLGVLLWTIVVFTALPIPLRQYRFWTQISLAVIFAILHFQAFMIGIFSTNNPVMLFVSLGLSAIFVLVAWPMIANRLWQWTHYQRAVDTQVDTDPDAPGVQH